MLPLRSRNGGTSNNALTAHDSNVVTQDRRFVDVDPTTRASTSVEPEERGSAAAVERHTLLPVPTSRASQAPQGQVNRELFESLRREFGTAKLVTSAPGLLRKRANSVDAASSRIDPSKRLRGLESVSKQDKVDLPAFTARPADREIIIVSDDDWSDDDVENGAVWFDYDGPQREPSDSEDEPDTHRVSGRLREKKKTGSLVVSGSGVKAAAKGKARSSGGRKRRSDGNGRGSAQLRQISKSARGEKKPAQDKAQSDTVDANQVSPSPWQGPINLEPFDGGIGLSDEDLPVGNKALQREARLFPGPARPTEQYWRRRVRVSCIFAHNSSTHPSYQGEEFRFFECDDTPVSAIAFGEEALSDLRELQKLTRREWLPGDASDSIIEIAHTDAADLAASLSTAMRCQTSKHKVLVARNAVTCATGSFEDIVRPFIGSAPMECQSEWLWRVIRGNRS